MDGCSDRYHVLMIPTTDHRHIGGKYLLKYKCPSRIQIEHRSCKRLIKKHTTLRHARHGVYKHSITNIIEYVIFYTQENFDISRFLMDMLIQHNNLNNIIFICILQYYKIIKRKKDQSKFNLFVNDPRGPNKTMYIQRVLTLNRVQSRRQLLIEAYSLVCGIINHLVHFTLVIF